MTYDDMLKTFDQFEKREIDQQGLDEVFKVMGDKPCSFKPELKQVFLDEVFGPEAERLRERILEDSFSESDFRVLALYRYMALSKKYGGRVLIIEEGNEFRGFVVKIMSHIINYAREK